MSYTQLPEQRSNLMWGVGAAFTSYVATTALVRRPSNLFTGSWKQVGLGGLTGSVAGLIFVGEYSGHEGRIIKGRFAKLKDKLTNLEDRLSTATEQKEAVITALDQAYKELDGLQRAVPEVLPPQELSNSLGQQNLNTVQGDDGIAPAPIRRALEKKGGFAHSIALGGFFGVALSVVAALTGRGGRFFGQNAIDMTVSCFSLTSLLLLLAVHSVRVREVNWLNELEGRFFRNKEHLDDAARIGRNNADVVSVCQQRLDQLGSKIFKASSENQTNGEVKS